MFGSSVFDDDGDDLIEEVVGGEQPPVYVFANVDDLIAAIDADPPQHDLRGLWAAVQAEFRHRCVPGEEKQRERLSKALVELHEKAFGKIHAGAGALHRITELPQDQMVILNCLVRSPYDWSTVLPYPHALPRDEDVHWPRDDEGRVCGRADGAYGAPWELYQRALAPYRELEGLGLVRFFDKRGCATTPLGHELWFRIRAGEVKVSASGCAACAPPMADDGDEGGEDE